MYDEKTSKNLGLYFFFFFKYIILNSSRLPTFPVFLITPNLPQQLTLRRVVFSNHIIVTTGDLKKILLQSVLYKHKIMPNPLCLEAGSGGYLESQNKKNLFHLFFCGHGGQLFLQKFTVGVKISHSGKDVQGAITRTHTQLQNSQFQGDLNICTSTNKISN